MNALAKAMLAAACILCAGPAAAQDAQPAAPESPYQVLEENDSISFPDRTINSYRIGQDRSLILETTGHRYYRAELDLSCARDLHWEMQIGIRFPPASALTRNDIAIIDGRNCFLRTLDRIADPRPVDDAARAARAAERAAEQH